MMVELPMFLSHDGYNALIEADIICGIVPDRWIFVDGKLNRWDNFMKELNDGELSFESIKVSLVRYADLTSLIKNYEQSDSEETIEEESNLRTTEHTKLRSGSRR